MRVSTVANVSSTLIIEQSAMISGCGRGRGRDHDFRGGRGLFRGGRGSYGGIYRGFNKGPRQYKHCRRNNHISEKCWKKFGHLEWAQMADADSSIPGGAHVLQLFPLVLLALPLWCYHRKSMIDCVNSSSLRTVI